MIVESLYDMIERGKNGHNIGLPTGLDKLDSITYGLQQSWMTTIGGDTGSGKSSLMLYMSVYRAFMNYIQTGRKTDINWLLFSFELSAEVIFAKLLSIYIYEAYHVIISYSDILSFNETISQEMYKIVLESKPWLDELESKCTIIDKPTTADQLYAITKEWTKRFGVYNKMDDYSETYIPKTPEQYLIVTVDHVGLLKSNTTLKAEIEKMCEYLIYFRNKCRVTIYVVQQLNRNFKNMDRRTEAGGVYQGIQLNDFKESSATTDASENVIAIFHPFREKLSTCNRYKVKDGLGDRMRVLSVLKHRFGKSDVSDNVSFYGEIGIWNELPEPDTISSEDYKQLSHL